MSETVTFDVEVECDECNDALKVEFEPAARHRSARMRVTACARCREQAEVAARAEGDEIGYDRGLSESQPPAGDAMEASS